MKSVRGARPISPRKNNLVTLAVCRLVAPALVESDRATNPFEGYPRVRAATGFPWCDACDIQRLARATVNESRIHPSSASLFHIGPGRTSTSCHRHILLLESHPRSPHIPADDLPR